MREQILYYAWKYQGEWRRIAHALQVSEKWEAIPYKGNYITRYDDDYPDCFKELEYAPWILFYEGDLALCAKRCVGIIGSRDVDGFGVMQTQHITNLLKQRYVIVSGLAKGVDAIAHKSALDAHTIGVIGCGLAICYPKENTWLYNAMRTHQLILSEYPLQSKPEAYHFPWRNRLIAALSEHIIVVEARRKSGTMLTVNEALTLNKTIWCIPHDFKKERGLGCNQLIAQGANILIDDDDIKAI